MFSTNADYRKILRRELDQRCKLQPRYSMRAFARDLSLSPSRLSEVLNGKQGISRQAAKMIATTLNWDEQSTEIFCDLVESEHARGKTHRDLAKIRLQRHTINTDFHTLQMDTIQAVQEWYHFAILQMVQLSKFKNDVRWISRSLGIQPDEARDAIARLKRLKLLESHKGTLRKVQDYIATPDGTPSEVLKSMHRQILNKALEAVDSQGLTERSVSAVFVSVDQSVLPEARKWIKNFRRKFCQKVSERGKPDSVYCFSVQFFNLMKTDSVNTNHALELSQQGEIECNLSEPLSS